MRAGEGQREQEEKRITSSLRTVSTEPDVGFELMNHEVTAWAKIQSETLNRMSRPGGPGWLINYLDWVIDYWSNGLSVLK